VGECTGRPDVVHVIDSGLAKEAVVAASDSPSGGSDVTTSLEATWIAQANARQRRGRAGRVQQGCALQRP